MAYSYVQYVGNGINPTYSVPFAYIAQAHVEVRVNNVLKAVGTDYTWASANSIQFVTAPAVGVTVDIRRKSSPSIRLVDFQDGSTLTEKILDADSNQNFFLAQEAVDAVDANIALATDGVFDAKSKRIKNVADPVNAQDAVTKNWAETANSSNVAQSTAQAAASAASAANSLSSANASAASATSAAASAATATTKASEASTSATSAASSATSATSSKNAAATSETNAAASAAAAASSASSASSSAATATTKANEASASATTASTKAADASSSATQAANSASGAATSATNAASSASSAAGSATSAASSASSASTSATNAASSATSASGSASTATTKAAEAAASATTATTQASTATTKASEAAASAVSAANSAAAAATALDNFDDRYLGQKTADPTLDNDGNALVTGALYFNTVAGKMKVFTGSGWIDASSASVATLAVFNYVATAGQTTFSGNDAAGVNLVYTVGAVIVTLNGIDQKNGVDYTATNGSSIVLTSAAAAGDELRVYAFGNFQVADTYSQAAADAKFLAKTGGTMTGSLALPSGGLNVGSGQLAVDSSGRVTMPYQVAFFAYDARGYVAQPAGDLRCDTPITNRGSCYNAANGRFTAPAPGLYVFSCNLQGADTYNSGNPYISAKPMKNGANIGINEFISSTTATAFHINVSPLVAIELSAGDYFTWYCSRGYRSGGQTSMTGYLLG